MCTTACCAPSTLLSHLRHPVNFREGIADREHTRMISFHPLRLSVVLLCLCHVLCAICVIPLPFESACGESKVIGKTRRQPCGVGFVCLILVILFNASLILLWSCSSAVTSRARLTITVSFYSTPFLRHPTPLSPCSSHTPVLVQRHPFFSPPNFKTRRNFWYLYKTFV